MDAFLRPWLDATTIPHITARTDGDQLIVTQHGPIFSLPLEVALITASGAIRRTLAVAQQQDTLAIGDVGPVSDVLIDPDHRLLLHRPRGEKALFEISAPDADAVALSGDFTSSPIPAVRNDGVWSVEVPLSAGMYAWNWTGEWWKPACGLCCPGSTSRHPIPASAHLRLGRMPAVSHARV